MTTSKNDDEKLASDIGNMLAADLAAADATAAYFQHGPATMAFHAWWKGDDERAKCTLEQAIGAYCSTFPGRVIPLLVELLQ